MTDRERRGNEDAPPVDENEVRAEDRSATNRSGDSERSGTRRVEDARKEREAERDSSRASSTDRDNDRGTSWLSVILGWLTALGAGLILSGIVGAIVGAILGSLGVKGGAEGGVAALVGLLVTLLLAFIIGGYVAGRLASRSGLKHGLFVPLLALVITLLLAGIGALIGTSFIDQLSGITLPKLPSGAQSQIPNQGLGTILTGAGILALLVPFIGGALGGARGAKTGRERP